MGVSPRADDRPAVLDHLGEVAVLQVLVELPLAEFVLAARLGDERQMGVLGHGITERLDDEDLAGVLERCSSARMTWVIWKS